MTSRRGGEGGPGDGSLGHRGAANQLRTNRDVLADGREEPSGQGDPVAGPVVFARHLNAHRTTTGARAMGGERMDHVCWGRGRGNGPSVRCGRGTACEGTGWHPPPAQICELIRPCPTKLNPRGQSGENEECPRPSIIRGGFDDPFRQKQMLEN